MRNLKRWIPLLAILILMQALAPEHKVDEFRPNSTVLYVVLVMVATTLSIGFTSIWSYKGAALMFLLFLPIDMIFTQYTMETYGWGREVNPWVGATHSVWVLIPLSLAPLVAMYPVRDVKPVQWMVKFMMFTRMLAVFSHPIVWLTLG